MAKQGKMFDISKLKKAIEKKQATINRNSKKLKTAPKTISIGWFKQSGVYPEQGKRAVNYVAKIHEHGLGNHTEKGMIKNTVHLYRKEWVKEYRKLARKEINKGKTPDYYSISEKVGLMMKEDLRNYVYRIGLVDTSRLANSILVKYKRR